MQTKAKVLEVTVGIMALAQIVQPVLGSILRQKQQQPLSLSLEQILVKVMKKSLDQVRNNTLPEILVKAVPLVKQLVEAQAQGKQLSHVMIEHLAVALVELVKE